MGLAGYKQPMQTEIAASVAPLVCVAHYNGFALVVVVSVVGLSGLRVMTRAKLERQRMRCMLIVMCFFGRELNCTPVAQHNSVCMQLH